MKNLIFEISKNGFVNIENSTFFTEKHAETQFWVIQNIFWDGILNKIEEKMQFFNIENLDFDEKSDNSGDFFQFFPDSFQII